MITEDYTSFKVAKLLKEKGFKFNSCSTYYTLHGEVCEIGKSQEIGIAPRPTLQMTLKWLREVHKLYIVVRPYVTEEGFFSLFSIKSIKEKGILANLRTKIGFTTYEEAAEKAIRYSLENLI